jgi:hypothetical protein
MTTINLVLYRPRVPGRRCWAKTIPLVNQGANLHPQHLLTASKKKNTNKAAAATTTTITLGSRRGVPTC